MDKIKKAYAIAKRELRGCYDTHGIVAGRHHFSDYWGRDGFFACFGALALGDYKIAEKMVDLFYSHQNSRGLIPYRLMNAPITLGQYLGKERKRYDARSGGSGVESHGALVSCDNGKRHGFNQGGQ